MQHYWNTALQSDRESLLSHYLTTWKFYVPEQSPTWHLMYLMDEVFWMWLVVLPVRSDVEQVIQRGMMTLSSGVNGDVVGYMVTIIKTAYCCEISVSYHNGTAGWLRLTYNMAVKPCSCLVFIWVSVMCWCAVFCRYFEVPGGLSDYGITRRRW